MRGQLVDRFVAELAGRQYGVVTRAQLRGLGLSEQAIDRRLSAGRLHRVHRGVYAVGHPLLSGHGRWMAAVLACGSGAALSHASAAALWGIRPTAATRIDVSVPTPGGRIRPGIRVHRTQALQATTTDGIPVTTPERTILDLAATLPQRRLEKAIDQAEILGILDFSTLDALSRARAGGRGTRVLRQALEAPPTMTRSELEERFRAICREHRLPEPRCNVVLHGFEVDFLFDEARVVVEADGWAYHRTRAAFERDRGRDAALRRAGYTTLRFTDRQLADGAEVAATVGAALAWHRSAA